MNPIEQIPPDDRIASIEFGLIATGVCVATVAAGLTIWAWVFF